MADAQRRVDPINEAERLLDLMRQAHKLEIQRTTALIKADALEHEADGMADLMLDDPDHCIRELARIRNDRNACIKEAQMIEKLLNEVKWELSA